MVEGRVNEEVWEECILPESKTPQLVEAQGMIAMALFTIQEGGETHGESKTEKQRGTNAQPLIMDGKNTG